MDGILLAAMAANAEDPGLFTLSSDALGPPEPYGLMLRRDDAAFVDAVNTALLEIFTRGDIGPIYEKWFTTPIPPHGVNLHFPMSDALAAAFASPAVVGD
jgi:glutamate/aspartate transport system substrate-binding protein